MKDIIDKIPIKPYYQEECGVIYNADCLDVMKYIPDKCVDLVLTDPPYGLSINYEKYNDAPENLKPLIDKMMPENLRISKKVVLTPGVTNIQKYPEPYWIMIWKYNTTNTRGKWGFNQWQPILCYGKDPYLENCMGARSDILDSTEYLRKSTEFHPCEKPIQTWKKLLERSSVKETDLICDPFLGSGTTAVACKQLGRKFIGIEISEKYCEIAVRRLAQDYLF